MQLANFSAYVFMFLVGMLAYQRKIFDKIDYSTATRWFYFALGLGILGMFFFPHYVYFEGKKMTFLGDGGINWISFLFALWESTICVTTCFALIGIFKRRFNQRSFLHDFLSANAFGVYFFHPPVLITVSLLAKKVELPALMKWVAVSVITLPVTFLLSRYIRSFSLCRKIFS